MGNNKKKVSILMMTYNNIQNIKDTMESVEEQDYPNIEIVLSDSTSTDGTIEFIREFEKKTKHEIKWISEPDKGLYDALNKDIKMATGDYLLVFNDQFIDKSAISKLVDAIESGNFDGAHADLIYADQNHVKRYWKMKNGTLRGGWLPAHPTMLIKKEVYEKYGLYNQEMKIAADYEFMIRMLKDKTVKLAYVPEILVRMYYGGTSTASAGSYFTSLREGHRALVCNGIKYAFAVDFFRTVRVVRQFMLLGEADDVWREYQRKYGCK